VRYELSQYQAAIQALELLCQLDKYPVTARLKHLRKKNNPNKVVKTNAPPPMESKWVDLLIKAYVKTGRTTDAITLSDVQLATMDKSKDAVVHARVSLNVYPWRHGSAWWDRLQSHFKDLKRAVHMSLTMNATEVETTSMRMSPHNSLIFLSR
jgi:hypothetical protein